MVEAASLGQIQLRELNMSEVLPCSIARIAASIDADARMMRRSWSGLVRIFVLLPARLNMEPVSMLSRLVSMLRKHGNQPPGVRK